MVNTNKRENETTELPQVTKISSDTLGIIIVIIIINAGLIQTICLF